MRSLVAAFAVFVLLLVPAAASAAPRVSENYTLSGDPYLSAYDFDSMLNAVVEWRQCDPGGGPCTPLPASAYPVCTGYCPITGGTATPGETPAGTTFEAAITISGTTSTLRTPVWTGRVASSSAPSVAGDLVVGGTVRLVPGEWAGGWDPATGGTDHSDAALVACSQPAAGTCFLIGGATAVLDQRWAGWYVSGWERRNRAGTVHGTDLTNGRPFPVPSSPPVAEDALFAPSVPVGPICCATPVVAPIPTATTKVTATAPKATIRARALRSRGRLLVGRVTCEQRCTVRLSVRGGGRTTVRTLHVKGVGALAIAPRHGKLSVRVVVDGKLVKTGHTRA